MCVRSGVACFCAPPFCVSLWLFCFVSCLCLLCWCLLVVVCSFAVCFLVCAVVLCVGFLCCWCGAFVFVCVCACACVFCVCALVLVLVCVCFFCCSLSFLCLVRGPPSYFLSPKCGPSFLLMCPEDCLPRLHHTLYNAISYLFLQCFHSPNFS